jgi:F0F1-type ATP synthase assembly protein I
MAQADPSRRNVLRTLLIVLVGQVGCVTFAVVLLSVLAGMWLDAALRTKPLFTLLILMAGVPVSILVMLQVARRTLAKIAEEQNAAGRGSP